jgi:hypothetical protein
LDGGWSSELDLAGPELIVLIIVLGVAALAGAAIGRGCCGGSCPPCSRLSAVVLAAVVSFADT